MAREIQICPHCGNYVQAEKIKSYTNKVVRQGTKSAVHMATSAGGMYTGAAVGSAFGPVGTFVGGAIGFIGSAMYNQKVNEGIDAAADLLTDFNLKFQCPKCGHSWLPGDDNPYPNDGGDFDDEVENNEYQVGDEDFDYLCDQFKYFVNMYLETEEFIDFADFKRYIFEVENFRRNNCEEPSFFWGKFTCLIAVAKCEYFIKDYYIKTGEETEEIGFDEFYEYCIATSRRELLSMRNEYKDIFDDDQLCLIVSAILYMLEMYWRDEVEDQLFYDLVREDVESHTDNFQSYSDIFFNDEWIKQMFYYVYRESIEGCTCYAGDPIETHLSEVEYEKELKNLLEDYGEIGPKERNGLERLRVKLGISEEKAKEIEQSLTDDSTQMTESEMEYLEEYKSMLADYGELGTIERKRLNRIREKLNISSERAIAIETSLKSSPLQDNEMPYLEAYKELLEDYGQIGENERKRLNRLRDKYGISEDRAFEIENMI